MDKRACGLIGGGQPSPLFKRDVMSFVEGSCGTPKLESPLEKQPDTVLCTG